MVKRPPRSRARKLFMNVGLPAGALFMTIPLTGAGYLLLNSNPATSMSASAATPLTPPQNSIYGDISLTDWQWARGQAVRETLEYRDAREAYVARGGNRDDFQWTRPPHALIFPASISNQRLLIIDLGHNDRTEGDNYVAQGAQASNGRTESQFVNIQGRALSEEAQRLGYRVVFIRAPDEVMDVPEFSDFSMGDRKSYYARTRGAQIDYIAQRLGFSPANTRAISLHMDRSGPLFDGENENILFGTALYVDGTDPLSVNFARAMSQQLPHQSIAPYVRDNGGINQINRLALPRGAVNIPTILYESNFMTDQPHAVEFRASILHDNGQSWAQRFMIGINSSFAPTRAPQTQIAYNGGNLPAPSVTR